SICRFWSSEELTPGESPSEAVLDAPPHRRYVRPIVKLLRTLIVFTLAVSAYGVARVSSTEELKRLARLPKIELAPPLEYNRLAGFVIFPDSATLNAEAAKIQKQLKAQDSPKPVQLARLGEI